MSDEDVRIPRQSEKVHFDHDKAEEARRQATWKIELAAAEFELKRKQELHALDLEERKSKIEGSKESPQWDAAKLALLGTVTGVVAQAGEFVPVFKTKVAYGGSSAMRAEACRLYVAAAEKKGTPEALMEAAEKILSLSEKAEASEIRMATAVKTANAQAPDKARTTAKGRKKAA